MSTTFRLLAVVALVCPTDPACGQTVNPSGLDGARVPFEDTLVALRAQGYQTVTDSDQKATLSLDDLRKGQLAWREKIQSLKVTFTYEDKRVMETASDLTARAEGRDVPPVMTETQTIAVKGVKFYREVQGNFLGALAKTPKTKPTSAISFNGTETREFANFQMSARRSAGIDPAYRMSAMIYGRLASLPYGPDSNLYQKTLSFVPTALSRADWYRVKSTLEVVDGRPCHVVLSARDAIWVDAGSGFCVRRRATASQTGPDDPGSLSTLQMCSDFVEPVSGVWLPKTGVTLNYTSQREPESIRGKLSHIQTVKVSRINVNDISDELFELNFTPGTMVADEVAQKVYHMPHGEDALDRAIAEGKPFIDGKVIEPYLSTRQKVLLGVAGGMAVILVALVLTTRWRRASRAGRSSQGAPAGPK
jgi:hypothetical protein